MALLPAIMREMLDEKLARFESLEKQMSDPEILADSNKMAAVAREHGGLVKLAGTYKRFLEICDELQSAEEMLKGDDAEMAELAEAEILQPARLEGDICSTIL